MIGSRANNFRVGFSLMEMILATAILAGSGAALFALLGNGSMYGRRAQENAEALRFAENLLAQAAVELSAGEQQTDDTSTYEDPRWVSRISKLDHGHAESLALVCLTVEVARRSNAEQPLCRLVRWVRIPRSSLNENTSQAKGAGNAIEGSGP